MVGIELGVKYRPEVVFVVPRESRRVGTRELSRKAM